jgi:hypothetical protein
MHSPTRSSCEFCVASAAGRCHGFRFDCRGCAARTAARSQPFAESRKAGKQTQEYRHLIDSFGVTHDEVIAAARADRLKTINQGEKK